ncbi:membrane dipeptidase [Mesorhizobium sp. 1M-11]|uniref:membrane dipeptidase n=1 Tax=Mesorhizobium sp. 1M-11 TaxID=1529006 RepID=UPI0006C736A6|nr:membrane dipeptidase [Mesorhizobium sp. 1M-11]
MSGNDQVPVIDCLQYCNYSEEIFRDLRIGGVNAIHTTISYHEDFRETVENIVRWNRWFETYPDLIFAGRTAGDVRRAQSEGRTAVFFGLQNCSSMEDDIGLVQVLHELGVRFMQLSYNNQSLLATGCYEANDPGITRMGREVIAEMNRVGMVIDMSHSATRSTLEAIELSKRPIAVTHANLHEWHPVPRNKPVDVMKALAETGGMLGFSLYPHHLRDGSACSLESFCSMVARAAEIMGVKNIGIGSDLCQDQPDEVVQWMRRGKWTKEAPTEGVAFPSQPDWFGSNRDFRNVADGLKKAGFSKNDTDDVMGGNWLRFFEHSFSSIGSDSPASFAAPRIAAQGTK